MHSIHVNLPSRCILPAVVFAVVLSSITATVAAEVSAPDDRPTALKIEGTHFTLNGKPTFLLGVSYYAALSAPEERQGGNLHLRTESES